MTSKLKRAHSLNSFQAILILWSLTVTLLISIPVVVLLEMPLLHLEKFVFLELLGVGKKPTKH